MGEEKPEDSQPKIIYFADFGLEFDYFYNNVFSSEKLDLIDDFLDHYECYGLRNWKGKISGSWNVPSTYPDWKIRAEYAKKFNLWHAHIGLPTWHTVSNVPYLTSDQVLHFQIIGKYEIKLLTVSTHNPMDLPSLDNILDIE